MCQATRNGCFIPGARLGWLAFPVVPVLFFAGCVFGRCVLLAGRAELKQSQRERESEGGFQTCSRRCRGVLHGKEADDVIDCA